MAENHRTRRLQQRAKIQAQEVRFPVLQIHPNHFIEAAPGPAAYLPASSKSRFQLVYASPMPQVVALYLIGKRRTGAGQRHLPFQYIPELWQLVQAAPPQPLPQGCDPGIVCELEYSLPVLINVLFRMAADKSPRVVLVQGIIVSGFHGSEFEYAKGAAALPDSNLAIKKPAPSS